MIKGTYYLKSLKLCLFGLLISCIMVLGNSVNALGAVSKIGTSVPSLINDDYTVLVNGKGNLLTTYYGVGKRVFQIQNGTYFIRTPNSLPYIVVSSFVNGSIKKTNQGYVKTYLLCDYIDNNSGSVSNPQNCVKYNMNDGQFETVATRILNSLNNDGYYGYNYISRASQFGGGNMYFGDFTICFSSKEFNKSICFWAGIPNNNTLGCNGETVSSLACNFYTVVNHSSACNNYCTANNLSNSQELSPYFDQIPNSAIGLPPGNGNIVGGSTTNGASLVGGDVIYSECKVRNALNWYHFNGFSDKLCYGGLDNYSTTTGVVPMAGQGLDVEEIWFNTADLKYYGVQSDTSFGYSQWFNYRRNGYEIYKKNSDSIQNPFNGVPTVLLTYFGFIDSYGLQYTSENILNYCQLSLYTADKNSIYTGLNSDTICNASLISYVDQSVSSQLGTNPIVGSSWEGITDRTQYVDDKPGSGSSPLPVSTGFQNGVSFQNNFFNLLSQSFKFPTGSRSPALPNYIIIALIGLLFFRFIKR